MRATDVYSLKTAFFRFIILFKHAGTETTDNSSNPCPMILVAMSNAVHLRLNFSELNLQHGYRTFQELTQGICCAVKKINSE